jgi:hypothetical protein
VNRALRVHLGSAQVSRVVYGSIIGLALVVVLETHPPGSWSVVASLLATALAVAGAELYSDVLGGETRARRRLERAELRHIARDASAVAFGIAFPAVFFVLAAVGAYEDDTAYTIAKWSGLGLIGAYGYAAARLTGKGHGAALFNALMVALIGGFLIAIKALLH